MNAETPIGPFIRPAVPDDAEGIAKVHVRGWQEAYVGHLPQHVLDRQTRWRGILRPGVVHRLDRQTSGLMVVASQHRSHMPSGERRSHSEVVDPALR